MVDCDDSRLFDQLDANMMGAGMGGKKKNRKSHRIRDAPIRHWRALASRCATKAARAGDCRPACSAPTLPKPGLPQRRESAAAKRYSGHQIASETVLQPLQNFPPAIAHDFIQPHAAVHRDK